VAQQPDRSSANAPPIYVGAQKVSTAVFVDDGRLFVPVRGVFEAIGASVSYVAPHFVVVRKHGEPLAAFLLDRQEAVVGHRAVHLDRPPTRREGRIYVPLRVVAEAAGATVAYENRPPGVHIAPAKTVAAGPPQLLGPETAAAAEVSAASQPTDWITGVAVFSGMCMLLCLVLTARRFGPSLFRARMKRPVLPPPDPLALPAAPSLDRVALTSVEATGEARFRKELVTETQTIEIPVTREELVIEYGGEGGVVLIEGRQLFAGETVRIPLWEERVHVDVTKHVLLTDDIIAARRRPRPSGAPPPTSPPDFSIAEGNPS